MSDHIKIRKAEGTWVVRAGGAVLAETKDALELTEGSYAAVMYFPRGDVAMAFLEPTDTKTHCPHKGDANYFTIVAESDQIKDAAWSYESPKADLSQIAGHLAFYPDKVTVERV